MAAFLLLVGAAAGLAVVAPAALPYGHCYDDNLTEHGGRVLQLHGVVVCEPCTQLRGLDDCADRCRALQSSSPGHNYTVAGVEAGHECICGHFIKKPNLLAPDKECNIKCIGNSSAECGGEFRLWAANISDIPPGPPPPPPPPPDFLESRDIRAGIHVLTEAYLDQCYCVFNPKRGPAAHGTWTCVITADQFHEGGFGEHIESLVSEDSGASWQQYRTVEPDNMTPTSLPNAYATIALAPSGGKDRKGRVFAIYNFNEKNVTCERPKATKACKTSRNDELGSFVMKYSDDGGKTWSANRLPVPYRLTAIDNDNTWGDGNTTPVQIMWNVDLVKTMTDGKTAIVGFTKIGTYVQNAPQELFFLTSPNLFSEPNASKISWGLVPKGEHGVLPPGGNPQVFEEAHIMPLQNSPGYWTVGRTSQGYLGAAQTKDPTAAGGWSTTGYAQYWDPMRAPSAIVPMAGRALPKSGSARSQPGTGLKSPRGPLQPKLFANGMYLMLFYNNMGRNGEGRNPYWLAAGMEAGGEILWSQPEIVLFDRYHSVPEAGGYPDFLEFANATIAIMETNKKICRLHPINAAALAGLFSQHNLSAPAANPAAVFGDKGKRVTMPELPTFATVHVAQQGFSIELTLRGHSFARPGDVLFDSRDAASGRGVLLSVSKNGGQLVLGLSSEIFGQKTLSTVSYEMDAACSAKMQHMSQLDENIINQVTIIADAGPLVIMFLVDGQLCDGGGVASAGWAFTKQLVDLNGAAQATLAPSYGGTLVKGAFYGRALRVSEAIASQRATAQDM